MAYKITFDKKRTPILTWSDLEKQSALYKKENSRDEIFIKAEGRNIRSKPFRQNIIYSIYDYLLPKYNRRRIQIIIIFEKNGQPVDVVIKPAKFDTPRKENELFEAIIIADKEYSKIGGGVHYKFPMSQSEKMIIILRQSIEEMSK